MSGYFFFPNNSKNIKDHIKPYIGLYYKLKNLFPINSNNFQIKPRFIAKFIYNLIFCSSIRFEFETAFISEQIAENRFGA